MRTSLFEKLKAIVAAAAVVSALPAVGADQAAAVDAPAPLRLQPGLWEMRTRIEGGDAQTAQALARARAQLAALPPAQRDQLEQRMAAGRGVELRLAGDALGARICITREMAQRDAIAAAPPVLGNCRTVPARRDGNQVRFATLCGAPRFTVEGSTTLLSEQSFESTVINTIEIGGNTRMTTIRQSGRWIGDDCAALDSTGR